MRRWAMAMMLAAVPGAAWAAPGDFSCRNDAAEISCDAKSCAVETQNFTPMGLSRRGRMLEICAYSGCWSAPVRVRRTVGATTLLYTEIRGGISGDPQPLSVIYDAEAKVALMRWGGFAQPMSCSAR